MKFSNIRQITQANYQVDISWDYIESWLENQKQDLEVQLQPDFQRIHVWSAMWGTIVGNLIGACLFYWIDKWLTQNRKK